MYGRRYRRRGFGWLPVVLGFLVLIMLFSGPSHRPWFFIWPLFCVFPFFLAAAGIAVLFIVRWWWHGEGPKRKNRDLFYGEKSKRGDDPGSDIFYV